MIEDGTVTVTIEKMDAGSSLLTGTSEEGKRVDAAFLSERLFLWHEPSYYGTMLEKIETRDRQGVILPARWGPGYWAQLPVALHGEVVWPPQIEQLRLEGRLLQEVLRQGWFQPAAVGECAAVWRILREGEQQLYPDLQGTSCEGLSLAAVCERLGRERLDQLLTEALCDWLTEDEEAAELWGQLVAAYPAAAALAAPSGRSVGKALAPELVEGLSESSSAEFEELIGYRLENLPFAIGLRLLEPTEATGEWELQPLLLDRTSVDRRYPCQLRADGTLLLDDPEVRAPRDWHAAAGPALARQVEKWKRWWKEFDWKLNESTVWDFLVYGSGRLIAKGVYVELHPWWEALGKHRPQVISQLRPAGGNASGMFSAGQLVRFDWRIAIGDAQLDEQTFAAAVREGRRLIQINGQWVPLHPKWVQRLQRFLDKMGERHTLSVAEIIELYLSGGQEQSDEEEKSREDGADFIDGGEGRQGWDVEQLASRQVVWSVGLNEEARQLISQLEARERRSVRPMPEVLREVLRPYQKDGVNWLLFLRSIGFGGCLADDMGLGKTVQLIAYIEAIKQAGELQAPVLLIGPTSVLGNWQRELARFAPQLAVRLHYGGDRARGEVFTSALEGAEVLLTSYNLALNDEGELAKVSWSAIVLDEAQNIKNAYGKQSLAIRSLQGAHRIALTGTPVENRLNELWTIFDFLNPGYLGSLQQFERKYGWLEQNDGADTTKVEETSKHQQKLHQLRRLIGPFLLRRMKNDPAIQLDLPDKLEHTVFVPLTGEQAALYEEALQQMLEKIDRLTPMERRGVILATLGKLKQICNHPALYLEKAAATIQNKPNAGPVLAGTKLEQWIDRSIKLRRLTEMVIEAVSENGQVLVFTQYVEMGRMLQQVLGEILGTPIAFLHGGVSKAKRDAMVEQFQAGQQKPAQSAVSPVLILSLRAGGTGLNLTAANHVLHYDRWWNPAVEEQATDRAYRIGQQRDVQVHKYVAMGTLEERIDEMIARKKKLSAEIVGSGEQWVSELSTTELRELFSLRREWINE